LPKHLQPKYMIIFLFGENSYLSTQKLNEIKEKFIAKNDPSGLNIITLDGDKFDLEKFNNAASQSGFLVSKRLIIVKNLLNGKPEKSTVESLAEILKRLKNSENTVVFWEALAPDKRSALFKFLSKEKISQEFPQLEATRLTNWIKKYVEENNGRIENQAVNLLISFVGNDLWQLASEADKLIAYANKQTIAVADVKKMVQAKLDENIFGLVDAIGADNKPLALKLLNEQLALGLNEIYILTMIVRQFRILAQLKSLVSQKFSAPQIVSQTKLHPYVVKKLLPVSEKFNLAKLQKIYQKLAELDHKFKSTSLPPQTLLDLFILQI